MFKRIIVIKEVELTACHVYNPRVFYEGHNKRSKSYTVDKEDIKNICLWNFFILKLILFNNKCGLYTNCKYRFKK